jgi:hypothetical protein
MNKELETKIKNYDNLQVVIVDQASYNLESEKIKDIKSLIKEVEKTFDPIIKKAHEAHKEALNQKNRYLKPLEDVEKKIKLAMNVFIREQQRKLELEKLEKEKELRRQQEEEALKKAQLLTEQGHTELAEKEIVKAIETPVVVTNLDNEVQKQKGVSHIKKWVFELIDETKVSKDFLVVDVKKIGKTVSALGKDAEKLIGGIKVYEETETRIRV